MTSRATPRSCPPSLPPPFLPQLTTARPTIGRRFRADLFGESHGCPPVRPSGQLPREEREEASLLGRKRLKFVIGFFKRKIPRKSLQSSISFALRCVQ